MRFRFTAGAETLLMVLLLAPIFRASGFLEEARQGANPKPNANPQKTDVATKPLRTNPVALDLVQRSHSLNAQLTDEQLTSLFPDQLAVVERLSPSLTHDWVEQMFAHAATLDPRVGASLQLSCIRGISALDGALALSMLQRVDSSFIESSVSSYPMMNKFTTTVTTVMVNAIRKQGKAAFPLVLSSAAALGTKGYYPYSSVMMAALESKGQEITRSTPGSLISRFQQGLDAPVTSIDFAEMLISTQSHWSTDALKSALTLCTRALQQYPNNEINTQYQITINNPHGSVTGNGPVEIVLLRLAPLLKRSLPEDFDKLAEKYAVLSNPVATSEMLPGSKTTITYRLLASSKDLSAEGQKQAVLDQIKKLMWKDPEKVQQAIDALTDPQLRAEALALASENANIAAPERASAFANEAAEAAEGSTDPLVKFRALCEKLRADADSRQHLVVTAELNGVFSLANTLTRRAVDENDQDMKDEITETLKSAITSTVKLEPELTAAKIEEIHIPYEKARLLAAAALSLSTGSAH